MSDKTNECQICGVQIDDRIDMFEHIHTEHTLQERLEGLCAKAQPNELTGK